MKGFSFYFLALLNDNIRQRVNIFYDYKIVETVWKNNNNDCIKQQY